ncbi:ATP-binding protein [uncultured Clostridium sp.]|uniref:ATP-binding protein n=1 Tax=uncultured Clostridium sp. TaxID=59620 RepID=UPI0025E5681D|nr:ATP-binding protein [uncultured Clostridium sp.]
MIVKTELTNNSIDKLVTNKDFKNGICEYIWNGFDAGATRIDLMFVENEMGGISEIIISDNGRGIVYEELNETFKCVLDSNKKEIKKISNIHGYKGKGRFAFIAFAEQAIWETSYKSNDNIEKYTIKILKSSANEFNVSKKNKCNNSTGTVVIITGITSIQMESIKDKRFKNYLNDKFAWFLYLNKKNGYEITVNKSKLDYMEFIDETLSKDLCIEIDEYIFEVKFIKWAGRIKEKYYTYFINEEYSQVHKTHTSYNNKGIDFPHSIYVRSKYFNDFEPILEGKGIIEGQISIENKKNQRDKVFKKLNKEIKNIVQEQIKSYRKVQAPKMIDGLEKEGAFPKFNNNKYDLIKKDDLKEVLTEIYAVQPKIFEGSLANKKSIVGFLNLLLDTDEREGIINIMDNITKLTPEERLELNDVLKKTTLSRIIRTVASIQNRLKVIEMLKKLVYDEEKFTNERDNIQKIIENNYWLFGEQYHLVSADENFERALEKYTYVIDGYTSLDKYEIDNPEKMRRPDIFMCRSRSIYSENATEFEENIIVELKAPKVVINKNIYRQVEDYMILISKESKFNSSIRKWKFIMVSTEIDEDIESRYKSMEIKGKRFLVNSLDNFEMYAMTWDDVFKNFELNHKYILEKLEFNKVLIKDEVNKMTDKEGRELVNEITNQILNLKGKI